jgi:hypothetical protein
MQLYVISDRSAINSLLPFVSVMRPNTDYAPGVHLALRAIAHVPETLNTESASLALQYLVMTLAQKDAYVHIDGTCYR